MKNLIFDGKDYYLFRSLNDGNMQDLSEGKRKHSNRLC